MGVRLYIGGHAHRIAGESYDLTGDRCFTAAQPVPNPGGAFDPRAVSALLDSGAFSDRPEDRLSPADALDRQLVWEARAARLWGVPGWQCEAIVSYDRLIDEVWTDDGHRRKARWTVADAESAVVETIAAAAHLASRRADLSPRSLVLSCQGVTADQYADCAQAVLSVAHPADWLGLGGWCIIGRWRRAWMPEFHRTIRAVLPMAADAGLRRVHIFGVLWLPALGVLLWEADRLGIAVSTDSTAPALAFTRGSLTKAGARAPTWRANVAWWRRTLADLRSTAHYRPAPESGRQLVLF